MTITAEQALQQITSDMSVEQIREIIKQVDVNPGGEKVILYSGGVGDVIGIDENGNPRMQYGSGEIAREIAGQQDRTDRDRTGLIRWDTNILSHARKDMFWSSKVRTAFL
jgi:hypothetical protein